MSNVAERILGEAGSLPEGTPLAAKNFLHLGSRRAVDQALSRLAKKGTLMKVARGIYVMPVAGRFGRKGPSTSSILEGIKGATGEVIVPSGAAAANRLGLSTQVPMVEAYLTSGRAREFRVGQRVVKLKRAKKWELLHPGRPAGDAIRALGSLGPAGVERAVEILGRTMPAEEAEVLARSTAQVPTWMAVSLSRRFARA